MWVLAIRGILFKVIIKSNSHKFDFCNSAFFDFGHFDQPIFSSRKALIPPSYSHLIFQITLTFTYDATSIIIWPLLKGSYKCQHLTKLLFKTHRRKGSRASETNWYFLSICWFGWPNSCSSSRNKTHSPSHRFWNRNWMTFLQAWQRSLCSDFLLI